WVLDQGPTIALWGARNPRQLDPIGDVEGWHIDPATVRNSIAPTVQTAAHAAMSPVQSGLTLNTSRQCFFQFGGARALKPSKAFSSMRPPPCRSSWRSPSMASVSDRILPATEVKRSHTITMGFFL